VTGNVETGAGDITGFRNDLGTSVTYDKHDRPTKDLVRRDMGRCALVGNAPFLKHAKSGRAIDKHKTVWRFNLKGAVIAGGAGGGEFAGRKTHVRMFNRLRGRQLASGPAPKGMGGRGGVKEQWLFWYATSPESFPALRTRYPTVSVRQLAPSSVNFAVEVYVQLGRDLTDLGLGPFKCPTSLTSGIHSVVVAQHTCAGPVDVFGFSYSPEQARQGRARRPGARRGRAIGYSGHTWDLDVLVYRLMHLAGFVNICATDPLISS
jgi:hypothetical protein